MPICPLCGDVGVPKLNQLMTHIRVMHADDPQFLIQCNLQGCRRTFRKFTVYRNHVYGFHDSTLHEEADSELPPPLAFDPGDSENPGKEYYMI